MLHWPDSMFSYLKEEKLLFSQDAFGMHLASSERFADEVDESILDYEAATYYANILLPYSQLIISLLDKVEKAGIPIDIIAPDHGPIWRKDLGRILSGTGSGPCRSLETRRSSSITPCGTAPSSWRGPSRKA